MVLLHTVVYRCLWAICAHSTQWHVLIWTWSTPPITGAIEFDLGGASITQQSTMAIVLKNNQHQWCCRIR
jgi:hypothetical protein